jgi:probable O-glycosylation ligase (exosortase A-associated)
LRDIIIVIFFLASLPISFLNPVNGIILYALVSYLNPQKLTWSFAYNLPLSKGIALATLAGFIFYRGDRKLPITREIILLALFWVLASCGWLIASNPTGFVAEWQRFSKILLMIFVTVSLIKSKEDLRRLYWAVALSIGFYSLKGAIWGIRGGVGWVQGPRGSFFYGNNEIGLVINMLWPVFLVMARNEKNKWLKRLLWLFFWISPLTIVLTKSRGAALAMGVTGTVLLTRVKHKVAFLLMGCLLLLVAVPFVPTEWYGRMATIKNYEQDASARGRINAWHAAWNLALDRPLTGGGLRALNSPAIIYRYAPNPMDYHDVHSIYFEVLGEIGFPGLIVYLALIIATVQSLRKIIRNSRTLPGGEFFANYANATLLGLVAYLFNGIFLGLAYFDLFYQFVGFTVSLQVILRKELELQANNAKVEDLDPPQEEHH